MGDWNMNQTDDLKIQKEKWDMFMNTYNPIEKV